MEEQELFFVSPYTPNFNSV